MGFGGYTIDDVTIRRQTGISIIVVVTLWTVALCVAFHRRRYLHPIKERYWRLVLAGDVALYATGVLTVIPSLSVGQHGSVHCYIPLSILGSGAVASLVIMCTRAFFLLVQFELGSALLASQQLRVNPTAQASMLSKNWWVTHRHILLPAWGRRAAMKVVVCWLIFLALTGAWASSSDACAANVSLSYANVMGLLLILLCISCTLFVSWLGLRLRRFPTDGYRIKTELVMVVLSTGITIISIIVLTTLLADPLAQALSFVLIGIAWIMSVIGITTAFPLYMTYANERAAKRQLASLQRVANLQDLLAQPLGFDAFLRFTMAEFNSESLLFWSRIDDLKHGRLPRLQLMNHHHLQQHGGGDTSPPGSPTSMVPMLGPGSPLGASPLGGPTSDSSSSSNMMIATGVPGVEATMREVMAIWQTFLVPGAILEVNVAATTRAQTAAKLHSLQTVINHTLGDAAFAPFIPFFENLPYHAGDHRVSIVSPRRSDIQHTHAPPRSQTPPILGINGPLLPNGTPPGTASGASGVPTAASTSPGTPVMRPAISPSIVNHNNSLTSIATNSNTNNTNNNNNNTANNSSINANSVVDIGINSNGMAAVGLVMSSSLTPTTTLPPSQSPSQGVGAGGRWRSGSGASAASSGRGSLISNGNVAAGHANGSEQNENGPSSHRYSIVDHAGIAAHGSAQPPPNPALSPPLVPLSPPIHPPSVVATTTTTVATDGTLLTATNLQTTAMTTRRTPSPQPLRQQIQQGQQPKDQQSGATGSPRNVSPRTVTVAPAPMSIMNPLTPATTGVAATSGAAILTNGSTLTATHGHGLRSHVSIGGSPTGGHGSNARGSPGLAPANALLSPTSAALHLAPLSLAPTHNAATSPNHHPTNSNSAMGGSSGRGRSSSVATLASPRAWLNGYEQLIHDLRHIYAGPQHEILLLMQSNSYVRFRTSNAYTTLLASVGQWIIEAKSKSGPAIEGAGGNHTQSDPTLNAIHAIDAVSGMIAPGHITIAPPPGAIGGGGNGEVAIRSFSAPRSAAGASGIGVRVSQNRISVPRRPSEKR
jgi:hypothetical protein